MTQKKNLLLSAKKYFRGRSGSQKLLIGLSVGFVLFLIPRIVKAKSRLKILNDNNPQDKSIIELLSGAGYDPYYWVAVARWETGNYTSNVFKKLNNMFGMKFAQVRAKAPGTKLDILSGYAKYPTYQDSVLDLIAYLDYFDYPKTFDRLYDQVFTMKSKDYFEDTLDHYYQGVKHVWDQIS